MMALISIDTMAERYGILPSRLLEEASTFDLFVCNSALRFQQNKRAEQEGDFSHVPTEDLVAIKEGRL
jgi:hypothetical protein